MKCPSCGSTNHQQKRGPVNIEEVLVRRHICQDCGRMFVSAQTVLESPRILELLEEAFG
jgi:transposase-like protein